MSSAIVLPGIGLHLLTLVGSGLLLAGVVKGATGLGYASSALPFLVYTLELEQAIALVLMPAMATNVSVAIGNGFLIETGRRFALLYLAMLPGIALGIVLLGAVQPRVAVLVLGITIIAYALFALARPTLAISGRAARVLQMPVGLLNGVLTGLTGSQVMPLVPYVMALGLDSARLVQAINLGVLIASMVLAAALFANGMASDATMLASSLAVLPALAGVAIGQRLRPLIPAEHFRTVVLLVLLVSGAGMLLR